MKNFFKGVAIISTLLLSSNINAAPHKNGDKIFRAGASITVPDDGKYRLAFDGNTSDLRISMKEAVSPSFDFLYFLDRNWAVEFHTSIPVTHKIDFHNAGGTVDFGETSSAPLTFSAVYYLDKDWNFKPYVGAGFHYTLFFSNKLSSYAEEEASFDGLKFKNAFGLALQTGFDYQLTRNWSVNANVRFMTMSSDAKFTYRTNTNVKAGVDMNPWVGSFMVGYQF